MVKKFRSNLLPSSSVRDSHSHENVQLFTVQILAPSFTYAQVFACNGAYYGSTFNNDLSESVFRQFSPAAVSRVDSEFTLRPKASDTGPCPLTHTDHISCHFEFSIIQPSSPKPASAGVLV